MFQERLHQLLTQCDKTLAVLLVGTDGILVDSDSKLELDMDLTSLGAEAADLLHQVYKSTEVFQGGNLDIFSVETSQYILLLKPLHVNYFLLVMTKPEALLGKVRFHLEQTAAQLQKEVTYEFFGR